MSELHEKKSEMELPELVYEDDNVETRRDSGAQRIPTSETRTAGMPRAPIYPGVYPGMFAGVMPDMTSGGGMSMPFMNPFMQPMAWKLSRNVQDVTAWLRMFDQWYAAIPDEFRVGMLIQNIDPKETLIIQRLCEKEAFKENDWAGVKREVRLLFAQKEKTLVEVVQDLTETLKKRSKSTNMKEWLDEIGRKGQKMIEKHYSTESAVIATIFEALEKDEQWRAIEGAKRYGRSLRELSWREAIQVIREACGDILEMDPVLAALMKGMGPDVKTLDKKPPSFEELKGRYLEQLNAAYASDDPKPKLDQLNLTKSVLVANYQSRVKVEEGGILSFLDQGYKAPQKPSIQSKFEQDAKQGQTRTHNAGNNVSQARLEPDRSRSTAPGEPRKCYMCGQTGHYQTQCPAGKDLKDRGIIKEEVGKNGKTYYVFSDGSRIYYSREIQESGKTMIEFIEEEYKKKPRDQRFQTFMANRDREEFERTLPLSTRDDVGYAEVRTSFVKIPVSEPRNERWIQERERPASAGGGTKFSVRESRESHNYFNSPNQPSYGRDFIYGEEDDDYAVWFGGDEGLSIYPAERRVQFREENRRNPIARSKPEAKAKDDEKKLTPENKGKQQEDVVMKDHPEPPSEKSLIGVGPKEDRRDSSQSVPNKRTETIKRQEQFFDEKAKTILRDTKLVFSFEEMVRSVPKFKDSIVRAVRGISESKEMHENVLVGDAVAYELNEGFARPIDSAIQTFIKVKLNGVDVGAMLDPGASVGIVGRNHVRPLSLEVSPVESEHIVGFGAGRIRILGLASNVNVVINGVSRLCTFSVVDEERTFIVFGQPNIIQFRMYMRVTEDGEGMDVVVYDDEADRDVSKYHPCSESIRIKNEAMKEKERRGGDPAVLTAERVRTEEGVTPLSHKESRSPTSFTASKSSDSKSNTYEVYEASIPVAEIRPDIWASYIKKGPSGFLEDLRESVSSERCKGIVIKKMG
ncbi:hypothetical protein HDU93_001514, partial [Gonapodya sp. JEL0774]